ncbi:TPA: hypothetical protein N0F65_007592, partial [Lagenidium giganteum]
LRAITTTTTVTTIMLSSRALLQLCNAKSRLAQLRLQSARRHGLTLRHKSSLPAPQVMETSSSSLDPSLYHSGPVKYERVLPVADWAENALTIDPRQTLSTGLRFVDRAEKEVDELTTVRHTMTDAEVDQWLEGFEIPQVELVKCQSEEEVQHLRRLYARQMRLECSVYEMATDKRMSSLEDVAKLGRASHTNAAKDLIRQWMAPASDLIRKTQRELRSGAKYTDSNAYGPALLMLDAPVLAAIGLNTMLNLCIMDPNGTKFIKLALQIGKSIQEQIITKKENAEKRRGDTNNYYLNLTRNIKGDKGEYVLEKVKEYYEEVGGWDKKINLKVGAAVIDLIQKSCMVPSGVLKDKSHGAEQPAFMHAYVFERNRRAGVFKVHEDVLKLILKTNPSANVLPWTARYLPMLVPPKKWTYVANGGYLKLHTKIMRQRDSAWQMDCVKRGDMDVLYNSLNLLAEVPWVVNREVLDVILKIWQDGGGFGDLPQRSDVPTPEFKDEYHNDPAKKSQYDRMVRKINQHNQELHSLRCDTLYKLQVAEEFRDEEAIYFPQNMDFRGRVYPIPPNLNHLGSDLSRSLLIFRDPKPLGKSGLRWLKIHLANVFGVDKCSFDERVEFTEANLDKVIASARDPFGEGDCAWWKDADYPFLALGVCFDLKRALESPDPEKYMSRVPVHQDGSCNGLQHYAALGRDATGGQQVNLVPADRPSDVYSGVAHQVVHKVERDAAMEIPEIDMTMPVLEDDDLPSVRAQKERQIKEIEKVRDMRRRKKHAQFLLGTITRKVVKQTVMTSVYGVTYIGARKQISARLEETFLTKGHMMDTKLEDQIYHASCYAAEVTMESMGDLFNAARSIMEWLGDCASKVAANGQPMSWITPLGLPVVQPYRKSGNKQIRTSVQHVLMVDGDSRPVSNGRQKTAFPPNFVHSLDSTHMLMTARRCLEEDKIAFAAVHDSYWTHACSVDVMNHRLRQEFVNLYEQPLLDELLEQLQLRFPNTKFKPIPQVGDLDLKVVLNSPYFFN